MFDMKQYQKEWRERNRERLLAEQKEYRETHKESIAAGKNDWYLRNRERILEERKEYRTKHQDRLKKYFKDKYADDPTYFTSRLSARKQSYRQQVIELYSHGTCKCSHCSGPVEELHHTDPANGKWEKKEFTSVSAIDARKHQLDMYTIIPDYITPLCKKCHKEVHKQLKEEKHYE